MCWPLLTYGWCSMIGTIPNGISLKYIILTVKSLVLNKSALVTILATRLLISLILFAISYLTNEYPDRYRSVVSIEGGFIIGEQQWQDGRNLNFGWIIVLFVLFDVELVAFTRLLFLGSQVIELLLLTLILFGGVLIEWRIHSLNW